MCTTFLTSDQIHVIKKVFTGVANEPLFTETPIKDRNEHHRLNF